MTTETKRRKPGPKPGSKNQPSKPKTEKNPPVFDLLTREPTRKRISQQAAEIRDAPERLSADCSSASLIPVDRLYPLPLTTENYDTLNGLCREWDNFNARAKALNRDAARARREEIRELLLLETNDTVVQQLTMEMGQLEGTFRDAKHVVRTQWRETSPDHLEKLGPIIDLFIRHALKLKEEVTQKLAAVHREFGVGPAAAATSSVTQFLDQHIDTLETHLSGLERRGIQRQGAPLGTPMRPTAFFPAEVFVIPPEQDHGPF